MQCADNISDMPRTARLDAPGVLHHIMIRGIERQRIFRNIRDRDDLLERLSVILPETHTSCYAWAFLDNHAHIFLCKSECKRSLICGPNTTNHIHYARCDTGTFSDQLVAVFLFDLLAGLADAGLVSGRLKFILLVHPGLEGGGKGHGDQGQIDMGTESGGIVACEGGVTS